MVHYRVEPLDLHGHLFAVSLTVAAPAEEQLLSLPVWIPGSYMVREFSRHLQQLQARQGRRTLALVQVDKCSWRLKCDPTKPLELRYKVYAFDKSVRTAYLDSSRGFFNPSSLCLRVHGQEKSEHQLELCNNKSTAPWAVATGARAHKTNTAGWGSYTAQDYDALVDTPFELGAFWSGTFNVGKVAHRLIVAGAPESFDGPRLLADAQKICATAIRFWHGKNGKPPFANYTFLLYVVGQGYGGLEHANSTALICPRSDLPRLGQDKASEGYQSLLGLISHEYFHAWNVKRLRPQEFAVYHYQAEQYTQLLWFFEGFTSYYDDLLLRRAKLIDDAAYLKRLTTTINQVLQTPGRSVQSVAQASFDAWIKYYRPDENTANASVSYYTKGALVALCLDWQLRQEGRTNLDQVMQTLWRRCKAGPMAEQDLEDVLLELSGRSYSVQLQQWVHGTDDLPLAALCTAHGLALEQAPAQWAQRIGVRIASGGEVVKISSVLSGSVAYKAGLAAGDEWLGINGWRLQSLDDIELYVKPQKSMQILVARDRKLVPLTLDWPDNNATWRLVVKDSGRLQSWLSG